MEDQPKKQRRGFAAMDKELARRIASMGGIAAHRNGTAHEYTAAEARLAAAKSVEVRRAKAAARKMAVT